jgi:hypothetical protein
MSERTVITHYGDTSGNDAWAAKCRKCFRESGWLATRKEAEAWKCPGIHCTGEPRGD